MRLTALAWLLLASTASVDAVAQPSVFLGVITKADSLGIVQDCGPDIICTGSWVRYKISVEEHLSGPKIRGPVWAARIQHMRPAVGRRDVALFIIEAIDDVALRRMVKASHMLVDDSQPYFCIDKPLKDYGVSESQYVEFSEHCIWLRDKKED